MRNHLPEEMSFETRISVESAFKIVSVRKQKPEWEVLD